MNWEAIGAVSELVGAITVLFSLLHLASQITQGTATTRVQTVRHLLTNDTASADSMVAGPQPEILAKLEAGERLTPSEVSAYRLYMRGRVTEAWQVFYQRQNGMNARHSA